jgi:dihydrofolate reductase
MICGRTMHDVVDGWGDNPGFGMPVFVVTHRSHSSVAKGDTTFEFVTGGIEEALSRARKAADNKDIIVMGGADLVRQYLAAGLIEEFTLTIAPVLLGSGKRLFDEIEKTDIDFDRTAVVESPYATHLRYRTRLGGDPETRHE